MKLTSAIGATFSTIMAKIKARDIRLHPVTRITDVIREEQRKTREEWGQALKIRVHHNQDAINRTNKEFYIRVTASNALLSRMSVLYPELPWPELEDADIRMDEINRIAKPEVVRLESIIRDWQAPEVEAKPKTKPAAQRPAAATPINAKGQGA